MPEALGSDASSQSSWQTASSTDVEEQSTHFTLPIALIDLNAIKDLHDQRLDGVSSSTPLTLSMWHTSMHETDSGRELRQRFCNAKYSTHRPSSYIMVQVSEWGEVNAKLQESKARQAEYVERMKIINNLTQDGLTASPTSSFTVPDDPPVKCLLATQVVQERDA